MLECVYGINIRMSHIFNTHEKKDLSMDEFLEYQGELYDVRYIILEITKFNKLIDKLTTQSVKPLYKNRINTYIEFRNKISAHPSRGIDKILEGLKLLNIKHYLRQDIHEIYLIMDQISKNHKYLSEQELKIRTNYKKLFFSSDELENVKLFKDKIKEQFYSSISKKLSDHIDKNTNYQNKLIANTKIIY